MISFKKCVTIGYGVVDMTTGVKFQGIGSEFLFLSKDDNKPIEFLNICMTICLSIIISADIINRHE